MIYVPVDWEYFVGDIDIEPQNIGKETGKIRICVSSGNAFEAFCKCDGRWLFISLYRS